MATKKIKFYVLNIKIQSEKTGQERLEAYTNLIKDLTNTHRFTRLNKNEAITIYKPFVKSENGIEYFYGSLGKGISFFDKDEIRVLDNNNISKEVVNKERLLEPVVGDYIFIPSIHRFALIQKQNSISVNDVNKFLQEHLPKLIKLPEQIMVDFEKESSIIDEIFKARAIYSLSYEISYSNNDGLAAQGELFDNLLRDNGVGGLKVTAKSDHTPEGMNINNVDFLGGGIEVAKKNGTIKNAEILPEESNKKKKLNNSEKPMIQEFEVADDNINFRLNWFHKLINIYKTN